MIIRPYNAELDGTELLLILIARQMDQALMLTLPAIGMVAYNNEHQLIAYGALRQVEGEMGMLDSYITNPEIEAEDRDCALDKITKALLIHARIAKLNLVMAFSNDTNTTMRAVNHGFKSFISHTFQLKRIE